ncbi:MAG: HAMP domain-containing sensor histidine kinase [candidate division Zixibacteria bacterium]
MPADRPKYSLLASGRFNALFKGFILFGVCAIGAVFVYYTNDIIQDIRENEAQTVETYTQIMQLVASDSVSSQVTSVLFDEIILKSNFPIIVTDTLENPLFWKAVPGMPATSDDPQVLDKIREKIADMKIRKGEVLIYVDSLPISKIFYDDPALVGKLRLIPIVEMAMVVAFVFLALMGFQQIRLSEQRSIWVGMAKETAHQLGTPITSMMGWIDLLKSGDSSFSDEEIYRRIGIDLKRLETIANRFGKIGSQPVLKKADINTLTGEVLEYYRERLPHGGKGVIIDFSPGEIPEVNVNKELYNWVIENLIKNALESVDAQKGTIFVETSQASSGKQICVVVSDNGRGINRRDARRIFRPGFTTKKRGWGLGLSLSKRIIREYHHGSITLVKNDTANGATFEIKLPIS